MIESESDDDEIIQCEPIGPPSFYDEDRKYTFFTECEIRGRSFRLGDAVRIQFEQQDNNTGDDFGYALILAIFENQNNDTLNAEVRWFLNKRELNSRVLKLLNAVENELILSNRLDDIPAGSIIEHITIHGYTNPSQFLCEDGSILESSTGSRSTFTCRYLTTEESYSLHPIDVGTAYKQGLDLSHFFHAYDLEMRNLPESLISMQESLDPYSIAIKRLHISVIPDRLPCRSKNQEIVTSFIVKGLNSTGVGGPLLISGMPGSGKTATVLASIRNIRTNQVPKREVPEFEYVEINCLRIRKPDDAYSLLWRAISDESVSGPRALHNLNQYFFPGPIRATTQKKHVIIPIVCLLDEMEYLITKNQGVIYNFLQWSWTGSSQFVLITVANAMDVVDRVLIGANASRSNSKTTTLPFSSYTPEDIIAILSDRIATLEIPGVDSKTIEICARKAAKFTGDIRTALKIFQRALELLREEYRDSEEGAIVNKGPMNISKLMALVARASEAYAKEPYIYMLQQSCLLDQAIMIVICKHIKITGGNKTLSLEMIWDRLHDLMDWARRVSKDHPTYSSVQASVIKIPQYEIFQGAILRLLEEGYLADAVTSNRGKTWQVSENILAYDGATSMPQSIADTSNRKALKFSSMVGVRLDAGDIQGALGEINGLVGYVSV